MNLVGKIFVVLIMLMSVFFSAMAVMVYSTHKNWKDEVLRRPEDVKPGQTVGMTYRLEEEKKKHLELEKEKEDLKKQLAALRAAKVQQVAKLDAERVRLSRERDEIAGQLATLIDTRETAIEDVRLAQKNLSRLGEQIDGLRVAIRDARALIDTKFTEGLVKTEQLHIAKGQLDEIQRRNLKLIEDAEEAKKLVEAGVGGQAAGQPPQVEGFVTAVSNEKKLAEISLGSDDGMKEGHELEVFRDGAYVGQLVIVKTTTDRAVGKIARLVRPMNRGDKVAPRSNMSVALTP